MSNYTTLKPGDIRQPGDEYSHETTGLDTTWHSFKKRGVKFGKKERTFADWNPVSLLGHKILASDLCLWQYRRPA